MPVKRKKHLRLCSLPVLSGVTLHRQAVQDVIRTQGQGWAADAVVLSRNQCPAISVPPGVTSTDYEGSPSLIAFMSANI